MSLEEFATKHLGIKPWSKMTEIFEAVESKERKILVRSCNGAGKTAALAAVCIWYFHKYSDSIVLTTASSWTQVKRNLWGEIRRQMRKSELFAKVRFSEAKVMLDDKHYMIGISPTVPENAMGFHAPHILVAVDEATGINREIMDALTGNLTGTDAQIILICNPINMKSVPYEAEHSGQWKLITISAFEHPNVKQQREIIPGAVTCAWIEDRLRAWSYEVEVNTRNELLGQGEEPKSIFVPWLGMWFRTTPIVLARILGEWADLEERGFISMPLIEENLTVTHVMEVRASESKSWSLGVDIARGKGGDSTVYALFRGPVQQKFESHPHENLMETAKRIKAMYKKCQQEGIELIITIDDTGIGGGVTDKLKQDKIPLLPINFASKARGLLRNNKELANARAEMYFVLNQELLDNEIVLYNDKRFHEELCAVRLSMNANSTAYKMEDKERTKRRLGRSPDYADATALARYGLWIKSYTKTDRLF